MAKTSMIVKAKRTPKFSVRRHNRCRICGRPRGYSAQVRDVPHLLPRERASWRRSRRDEGLVVTERETIWQQ